MTKLICFGMAVGLVAWSVEGISSASAPPEFHLQGENWTYAKDGLSLHGILIKPDGKGPFPAVLISHGLGGNAQGFGRMKAREFAKMGMVCIACDYTHAVGPRGSRPSRDSAARRTFGASDENIRRASTCLDLVASLSEVDPNRLFAYGHSMGGFVTIGLASREPNRLQAAAVSGSGVAPQDGFPAPSISSLGKLRTPFILFHGADDTTVRPEQSLVLEQALVSKSVPVERHVFEGVGHPVDQQRSTEMFGLIRTWFTKHGLTSQQSHASAKRPNVLFIAVDDMRCDLGCYGNDFVKSPNLDRLAKSGVLFHRAYCQQAVCNASRASLMTGLRPDSTRVWDLVTDFRRNLPEAVTIPQQFRHHGYTAVAFGKIFHNTFPDDVSWSEPTHQAQDVIGYSEENRRRLAEFKKQMKEDGKPSAAIERMRGPATEVQEQPDNKNFDGKQTSDAIARMQALVQTDDPFFLAVGFIRPHLPFITPKRYWDIYDRGAIPLANNGFLPRGMPSMAFGDRSLGGFYELRDYMDYSDAPSPFERPLSEEQQRELRHGYYASVSFVDAQVGRLLNALDEMKIADNTVVVLWSDHGWKLGEHAGWCKQTNYEIDTRVPMIIRMPAAPANGRSCHALVEFIDIYPTLCEAAGLPIPPDLEGQSLVPLLSDPSATVKNAAISQFERRDQGRHYMGYAIRTENHRYVEWLTVDTGDVVAQELYDHRVDPDENENIAIFPEQQDLLAAQSRMLWATIPRPNFPHPASQARSSAASSEASLKLDWHPINDQPFPASRPTGEHRAVTFINERRESIELWWLGPNGDKQSYGELKENESKTIRTRRGAIWIIEDSDDQAIGHFVTKDASATATIPR